MRRRNRVVLSLALLGLGVGVLGVASAQTAPPATAPQQGAVGLQRPVALSIDEMQRQAETNVTRVEATAANVRRMLEQARTQRDVVKTLCLNEKLTQLDVTSRSARERRAALEAAAARRDNELVGHEFTILSVYRQRADRLAGEANQCIGNEAGYLGDTRVTATVDPTIPDDGTTPPPTTDPLLVPPATCASCPM